MGGVDLLFRAAHPRILSMTRSINLRHLAPAERNRPIGKALEMRAAKYQVIEIAEALNIDRRTVCYWTNPQSREKSKARARASSREARNEAKRRERERNGNNNVGHTVIKGPSEADYQARRGEVPQDTRSITERVFGDPIFQRSALGKPHA